MTKALKTALAVTTAAFALAACDSGSYNQPATRTTTTQTTTTVHKDLADLGDNANGQLVQGRDGCINAMVAQGQDSTAAAAACDKIIADMKAAAAQNNTQTTTTTTTTSTTGAPTGNVYYNSNNDALLWFMIGHSMGGGWYPAPYYYHPGYGYSRVYTGGHTTIINNYPTTINNNQASYLKAKPAERASIAQKLAAQPGAKMVTVTGSRASAFAPTRGGLTGSTSAFSAPKTPSITRTPTITRAPTTTRAPSISRGGFSSGRSSFGGSSTCC